MVALGGSGCTFVEQLCIANYPLMKGKNSLGFTNEEPESIDHFESFLNLRSAVDL